MQAVLFTGQLAHPVARAVNSLAQTVFGLIFSLSGHRLQGLSKKITFLSDFGVLFDDFLRPGEIVRMVLAPT